MYSTVIATHSSQLPVICCKVSNVC